jgi:hypothetical protein
MPIDGSSEKVNKVKIEGNSNDVKFLVNIKLQKHTVIVKNKLLELVPLNFMILV